MRPELQDDYDLMLEAISPLVGLTPDELRTIGVAVILERYTESIAQHYRPRDVSGVWEAADDALTPVVTHPERGR